MSEIQLRRKINARTNASSKRDQYRIQEVLDAAIFLLHVNDQYIDPDLSYDKLEVDELIKSMPPEEIKEIIHDWWQDYEIADGTEDNLLAYV